MYHALISKNNNNQTKNYAQYRWISYKKLGFILSSNQKCDLSYVYIFTAYPDWNKEKTLRHENLVRIWNYEGCKVIFGKFLRTNRECNNYKNSPISHTQNVY
jgi:hypothetical protein